MLDADVNERARFKGNVFGAIVALLVQYGLGVGANLYATLPADDRHKSLFPAFGAAISNGPAVVAAHAVFGTLLLFAAASAFARGLRFGRPLFAALAAAGLAAVVVAWISGATFVGHMNDGASLTMALTAGVAIFCYALILVVA